MNNQLNKASDTAQLSQDCVKDRALREKTAVPVVISPEAVEISDAYGLTESQAQRIVTYVNLVRDFRDGGKPLIPETEDTGKPTFTANDTLKSSIYLITETLCGLNDQQFLAVHKFALQVKAQTEFEKFFSAHDESGDRA